MTSEAVIEIPADHPALAGHFPGRPIVPGALLLALALQEIERAGGSVRGCTIASAKFLSALGPGESVRLQWQELPGNSLRFELLAGGRRAVTAMLTLAAGRGEAGR